MVIDHRLLLFFKLDRPVRINSPSGPNWHFSEWNASSRTGKMRISCHGAQPAGPWGHSQKGVACLFLTNARLRPVTGKHPGAVRQGEEFVADATEQKLHIAPG